MNHSLLVDTILSLNDKLEFSLSGDDLDNIIWLNPKQITPSTKEILEKYKQLKDAGFVRPVSKSELDIIKERLTILEEKISSEVQRKEIPTEA